MFLPDAPLPTFELLEFWLAHWTSGSSRFVGLSSTELTNLLLQPRIEEGPTDTRVVLGQGGWSYVLWCALRMPCWTTTMP